LFNVVLMYAVEFHGGERLELVERPDPAPGPGELLIAPTAVGICGTDVEIFEGSLVYFREGWARYPIVPGHEWVGEVVDVGAGVSGFAPGDQVTGETPLGCGRCPRCRAGAYHLCALRTETGILNRDGAMASRLVFPAAAAHAAGGIPARAAALVEPASVALNGARRGGVDGRSVLVVGAGTIGLLAAQCARAEGAAAVTLADTREDRLALAAGLGFARHAEDADEDAYDVVLLCAGGPAALGFALRTVRPGGTAVVLGLSGTDTVPVDMDSVVVRDLAVHGVLGSPHVWPDTIELVRSGRVKTEPLVSGTYGLASAREALERLTEPGSLKVLIEPGAG
jgi:2-desacetyl-2-hydroxyethyl bacteriochlorophyllide A dehydrogenase